MGTGFYDGGHFFRNRLVVEMNATPNDTGSFLLVLSAILFSLGSLFLALAGAYKGWWR